MSTKYVENVVWGRFQLDEVPYSHIMTIVTYTNQHEEDMMELDWIKITSKTEQNSNPKSSSWFR